MSNTRIVDRAFIRDAARQVMDAIDKNVPDSDLTSLTDYFVRAVNAYLSNHNGNRVNLMDDNVTGVIGEDYLD